MNDSLTGAESPKNPSKNCDKNNELMFDIKTSQAMGRYMVANRNIRPGEILLKETPLVVGPCTGCKVQCIGCYKNLEDEKMYMKCSRCAWPLCSSDCIGLHQEHGHTEIECDVLKKCESGTLLDYTNLKNLRVHLYALVPLRCLLLKIRSPDDFIKLLDMESHDDIRRNIPDIWIGNQTFVVDRIINDWKLTEYTEEEIHKICGILEVNAFQIGQQGVNIRALYPTAFLMSHDCVPNTNHIDQEGSYTLTVRSSTPIEKNYPITLSYAYTLQSTLKRRQHLLENKFFECCCKRCQDPTELGTYTGALICPKCKTGHVLSTDPLNPNASWSCTNSSCSGYYITPKSMKVLITRISEEVDNIDNNDIQGMEIFLNKYRNVLHPSHYLFLGIKLSLSQLYGKINGYLINELNENQLHRKANLCREIIKIFDIIEPGYTRLRGVTLYEMHAPLMILINKKFKSQSNSTHELKSKLKEVVRCLIEAKLILGFEPENSSEQIMGIAANEAIVRIKEWEKILGKI